MRHTILTFTLVKLCKRPKVNSKPTHFLNNGKIFPSLDDMTCSYQYPNQLQLLQGHWQAKRYWISRDLQKPDLSENNYNNTRNNMKSHIKNKKNRSISLWNSLYQHKQFLWGTNFFEQNHYWEVILNGKTIDQIMPSWGRSSINDKHTFQ